MCKSSDIVEKEVEEEIKVNSDIALYPVKVKVCNSCGERYYDRIAVLSSFAGFLIPNNNINVNVHFLIRCKNG